MPAHSDWVHEHVKYLLSSHPRVAKLHNIVKLDPGVYEIDGHRVEIEWQPAAERGHLGNVFVVDGPLRQPLVNYLEMGETNAEYDTHVISKMSSLHHVPAEQRVTFHDRNENYTRLEAMQVAKEQAKLREKAAGFTKEGQEVPNDLIRRYSRSLHRKLHNAHALGLSPRQARWSPRDAVIAQRCSALGGTLPVLPPHGGPYHGTSPPVCMSGHAARPTHSHAGMAAHGPVAQRLLPISSHVPGRYSCEDYGRYSWEDHHQGCRAVVLGGAAAMHSAQLGSYGPRGPCTAAEVQAALARYCH